MESLIAHTEIKQGESTLSFQIKKQCPVSIIQLAQVKSHQLCPSVRCLVFPGPLVRQLGLVGGGGRHGPEDGFVDVLLLLQGALHLLLNLQVVVVLLHLKGMSDYDVGI